MRYIFLTAALLFMPACTTAPIAMQNPQTGQTATCGPYPAGGTTGMNTAMREAQCIQDFKEQGFLRVAN